MGTPVVTPGTRSASAARAQWIRHGRFYQTILNTAWWLDELLPALGLICIMSVPVLLLLRNQDLSLFSFWTALAVAGVCAAVRALLKARSRFLSLQEIFVFMETGSDLDTALSAAHAGARSWPAFPERPKPLLRMRVPRSVLFSVAGPVLLLAGLYLPVAPQGKPDRDPARLPPTLAEVERLLDRIEATEVVDPQALELFEEELERLAALPPEEWYQEHVLEAVESMDQQLKAGLGELSAKAETLVAESSISSRGENGTREAERALEELRSGTLPLNPEFAAKLQDLRDRTAALESLKEKLSTLPAPSSQEQDANQGRQDGGQGRQGAGDQQGSQGSGASKGNQGDTPQQNQSTQGQQGSQNGGTGQQLSPSQGTEQSGKQPSQGGSANGQANGQGGAGTNQSGQSGDSKETHGTKGGVGRGPGAEPLNLYEKPPQLTSNLIQQLHGPAAKSELGDLLQVVPEAPEVRPERAGGAGVAIRPADAGDAPVGELRVHPRERDVVRHYFQGGGGD